MSKLKLIKLLYIADRESIEKWCESMTGDKPHSMRNGPILSKILDYFKPEWKPDEFWSRHIEIEQEENLVYLIKDPGNDDVCRSDERILDSVFDRFKDYSPGAMIDWCHKNLPEWEDPGESSTPIKIESILKATGKTDSEIQEYRQEQMEHDLIDLLIG